MSKSAMPKSKAKTAYGLLSEIRKLILEEPKRYNQETWHADLEFVRSDMIPACGTVCCIAGWVDTLKFKKPLGDGPGFETSPVFERARRKLGLDTQQARVLFAPGAAGCSDPGTVAHATSGAEHIARFQKKYAKRLKAKRV